MKENKMQADYTGIEIAVIGMAGRFPGAINLDEFWNNLVNGIEPISFFSDEEMQRFGVDPEEFNHPDYVKAKGLLEEIEYFDAAFFGYTPMEAEIMTPQMRIFLECAWQALEDAAYDPDAYEGLIGVFAGAAQDSYWEFLCILAGKTRDLGGVAAGILTTKDPLGTWISYKFNLKGPSYTLYTACSTSGVAIHQACQNLLVGECQMALAGAISVWFPAKAGYIYQDGMIFSPDGHCRVFDAEARGSVLGDGIGVVILKLLEDAVADGDHIYAVIKGSALNNDGRMKVGYTAPGTEGQAAVMRAALHTAATPVETISYIETHGTGTSVGDPIELEAIKRAYKTAKKHRIGIGSVKSNVGHLNTAAGMSGFIKTTLALKNRLIPPSLHFNQPNPKFDFENSPFYVVTQAKEWENNGSPIRAGVSAFGLGGTNFHAILEEAPALARYENRTGHENCLILLSAKTSSALERMTINFADYLRKNPGLDLTDVAYTLQVGRKTYRYRRMLVTPGITDAARALSSLGESTGSEIPRVYSNALEEKKRPIIFMFPGVGAQYVNMGRGLYENEPIFRQEIDRCFELMKGLTDYDLKEILYPGNTTNTSNASNKSNTGHRGIMRSNLKEENTSSVSPGTSAAIDIHQPEIAQVAIFVFEYALARLMMAWGIKPELMIGYSLGEYIAAAIAGVFTLEEALGLVITRARLIEQTPPGAMLSVPVPLEELKALVTEEDNVSIAIDNGPSVIVAGAAASIDAFERKMKGLKYMCMRVAHSRALHSREMQSILPAFREKLQQLTFEEPKIPFISNVTGRRIHGNDVTHNDYWLKHVTETVRFAAGISEIVKESHGIFLEIGPGRDLCALIRRYIETNPEQLALNLIRQSQQDKDDMAYLLERIGRLWLNGVNIQWKNFYTREKRQRISLPTYPFDRKRYWIEGSPSAMLRGTNRFPGQEKKGKKADISTWFYVPVWKQLPPLPGKAAWGAPDTGPGEKSSYLVLVDTAGIGDRLVDELAGKQQEVIKVRMGNRFYRDDQGIFYLDPTVKSQYKELINGIVKAGAIPRQIIHMWSISRQQGNQGGERSVEAVKNAQERGFYSLFYLAEALQKENSEDLLHLTVITNNMQAVCAEDYLCPEQSTVLGLVKVIPQENPGIRCHAIDILLPGEGTALVERQETRMLELLLTEVQTATSGKIVALRDNSRWLQIYEPMPLEAIDKTGGKEHPKLKTGGVYLITGGLGGIGLVLAKHLAQNYNAKLVLIGRTSFPARDQWQQWLDTHPAGDKTGTCIQKILELERLGGQVLLLDADASDEKRLGEVFAQAEKTFGLVNGVIHAAGINGEEFFKLMGLMEREMCDMHFTPKMWGLLAMQRVLAGKPLDFVLVMSSISSILGGLTFAPYSAANNFMDHLVQQHNRENDVPWTVVNWDTWQLEKSNQEGKFGASMVEFSVTLEEGIESFLRILAQTKGGQVIHSVGDLQERIDQWVHLVGQEEEDIEIADTCPAHSREILSTSYTPPCSAVEKQLVEIWQQMFHFEKIGIRDDFFELGGDSLKAIILLAKVRKALRIEIPLMELFNTLTIEGVARYIESAVLKEEEQGAEPAGKPELSAPPPQTFSTDSLEQIKKQYDTPIEDIYPCTPMQEGMLFHALYDYTSSIHYIQNSYRIRGKMEIEIVRRGLHEILSRHPILRTVFVFEGMERPMQVVLQERDPDFSYIDITQLGEGSDAEKEMFIKEFKEKDRQHPFDLSKDVLIRFTLIRLNPAEFEFLFSSHHILLDAWCMEILSIEFNTIYNGMRKNKVYQLPEVTPYRNYIRWLEKRDKEKTLEYWRNVLKGYEIPVGIPRKKIVTGNNGEYLREELNFSLTIEKTEALKELAVKNQVTLSVVFQTLWGVLLRKYCGQKDIVFGLVVSGRPFEIDGVESMVGMFINSIPVRIIVEDRAKLSDILQQVQKSAVESEPHHYCSLVEIRAQTLLKQNPYDHLLTFLNVPTRELFEKWQGGDTNEEEDSPLQVCKIESINRSSYDFDLVIDLTDRINILLRYNTHVYESHFMKRVATHIEEVLDQVIENSAVEIKDIIISHDRMAASPNIQMDEDDFML